MRPYYHSIAITLLIVASARLLPATEADKFAGLAVLKHYSPREMGFEHPYTWFVKQDSLGRLFVGGTSLAVFDGESWRSHAIGKLTILRTLEFGSDGKIWVGALNEIGYFSEPRLGQFEYHSMMSKLPADEIPVGPIWSSALVGNQVYFMGREKLYCWDGERFRIWKFPGMSRLFPLKLGTETWFQHRESGLYRITDQGPEHVLSYDQIPRCAIFGLLRDEKGLILVGELGGFREGNPSKGIFPHAVEEFMAANRVSSFAQLPTGQYVIGTVNDGLLVLDENGTIQRHINASDHSSAGRIMAINLLPDRMVWCSTYDGAFQFNPDVKTSIYNARNGLAGSLQDLSISDETVHAVNSSGIHKLHLRKFGKAHFEKYPELRESYTNLVHFDRGLLLGRHGGLDFWNQGKIEQVLSTPGKGVYRIYSSPYRGSVHFLSEGDALIEVKKTDQGDSDFDSRRIGKIPDFAYWIAEDHRGTVWAATASRGVFAVDPTTNETFHILDPRTGRPLEGYACFSEQPNQLLVFAAGQAFMTDAKHRELRMLKELPDVAPRLAAGVPGKTESAVAFKRLKPQSANSSGTGLARFTTFPDGNSVWQEFDTRTVDSVGVIQCLKFSEESGRRILWIGGTEGLLRLDYDTLPLMTPPPAPVIRLDEFNSSEVNTPAKTDFKFENHRVAFRVYTGDPTRAEDWLVQVRLRQNAGDWSAPSRRRGYEYSNLSHGLYQFEARTINAAGMASAPVNFSFRVLPPWYQSGPAYVGYSLALAASLIVTVRVRERRLRSQQAALEQLVRDRTEALLKANAAKDEFLAAISHEIRNPLNGVVGIAHSLPYTGLAPDDHRKFGLLRTCAEHLSSLLENLLDLSKIQAGVTEIDSKPFELIALVDSVVAMSAFESEHRRMPVQKMVHPDVPRYLMGDARRIRQILLNFVGNALKYSDAGTVLIEVRSQPGAGVGVIDVTFSVTDEGPGVPVAHQERLFGRFERSAESRDGKREGTGLGLAICRGFAEKMEGKVWLKSAPGRGSSFYFSAPFRTANVPHEASVSQLPMQATGRRALVVDDQEHNRIVLADLLERLGIESTSTGSGVEAVSLAAANRFDYVLIDYDLPDISGLQVAHQIRAQANGSSHAHLVAVTAYCTPEQKRECLEAGMDSFIGKPVSPDRLRTIISCRPEDGSGLSPTGEIASTPHDPLVNLRLLATRKCSKFEDELDLFVRELRAELVELKHAIGSREPVATSKYAHRLNGQLGFIYQRYLGDLCRRINVAATKRDWPCVDQCWRDFEKGANELEANLGSSAPNAPLG